MKIDDVYNFIDSLTEEEFYEYLTPDSYYNTNLHYSICGDNLPIKSNRKLIEIYFFLTENEDDIIQFVFEKMCEFSSEDELEDIEINGINWYIIIFYLSGYLDYYDLYLRVKSTNRVNKKIVNLLELNKEFNRDDYFIFNDTDQEESFYTKDITECVLLTADRDKKMNFEEILKTKEFISGNISFKKGDFILYNDFKEIKYQEGVFFDRIRADFTKVKRDIYISDILNESFIFNFKNFKNL